MVIVTDRDLAAARRLPDEFVKRHGLGASACIAELVGEHWKCCEDRARAGLAPVFKREAVSMWAQEELTSDVDALSVPLRRGFV
jgi:hypothetical protein